MNDTAGIEMSQPTMLDSIDVAARLRRACADAGGQTAFAGQVGVSVAFVNAVLSARKAPGARVLAAIGLRQIVRYVPVRAA